MHKQITGFTSYFVKVKPTCIFRRGGGGGGGLKTDLLFWGEFSVCHFFGVEEIPLRMSIPVQIFFCPLPWVIVSAPAKQKSSFIFSILLALYRPIRKKFSKRDYQSVISLFIHYTALYSIKVCLFFLTKGRFPLVGIFRLEESVDLPYDLTTLIGNWSIWKCFQN